MKGEVISKLDRSLEALEGVGTKGEGSEEWQRTVNILKQVFDAITDKVRIELEKTYLRKRHVGNLHYMYICSVTVACSCQRLTFTMHVHVY